MDDMWPRHHRHDGDLGSQLAAIRESLESLHRKADTIMSQQDELNQVGQTIETDVTAIGAAVTLVQAEIQSLQAANPQLDFTSVNSALSDLANATQSVTDAGNEVPQPAPPSSPTPDQPAAPTS